MLGALVLAGWRWLESHPQHNPWAPLVLSEPKGWATGRKLARLRSDPAECRAVLARSGIAAVELPAAGEGACQREDRLDLAAVPPAATELRPRRAEATCALEAGLERWLSQVVQPAAREQFELRVTALEHYGTFQCRRIGNAAEGRWSEHATANAIDISALVLEDGRRVVVRRDWPLAGSPGGRFLRTIRDGACGTFGTVLSPDYNAAHFDHFHLDQERRAAGWSFCR